MSIPELISNDPFLRAPPSFIGLMILAMIFYCVAQTLCCRRKDMIAGSLTGAPMMIYLFIAQPESASLLILGVLLAPGILAALPALFKSTPPKQKEAPRYRIVPARRTPLR